MRKRKFLIGAAVSVIAVSVASLAYANTVSQTTVGKITPKKLPKKKFKSATVNVTTEAKDGTNIPPPANHATIDLDKDIRFKPASVPKCNVADVAGQNTASVRSSSNPCHPAQVGTGSATLYLGAPGAPITGPGTVPVQVTAFNGKPNSAGQPTLILHTDPGFTPVDIIGAIKKSTAGKKYNKALDFIVPPTGGSLALFQTKVHKGNYLQARCKQKDHKFNFHGKFIFDSTGGTYPTSAEGKSTSKCKVKH